MKPAIYTTPKMKTRKINKDVYCTQHGHRSVSICDKRTDVVLEEIAIPNHVDCRAWSWMVVDGELQISYWEPDKEKLS